MSSDYPAPPRTTRTRSWIALALSLVPGLSVIGFFLGRSVLRRSRLGRDFGRRQAVAAISIAGLWFAAGAVVLAVAAVRFVSTPAVPPDTTTARSVEVTELALGDCLRDVVDPGRVATVTVVPCDETHHSEIYATFELRGKTHQSNDRAAQVATHGCSVRLPAETAGLDLTVSFFYPSGSALFASDKTVRCVLDSQAPLDHRFGERLG